MLRLSRLSRPLESINVRFTTPGHANPYFLDRSSFIDPSHPAARLSLSKLPLSVSPYFTIRAFPNALLREPGDFVPMNPILATALVRARSDTHAPHKWWSNLRALDDTDRHLGEGVRRRNNADSMRKHLRFHAEKQITDIHTTALAQSGKRNLGLLFHTSKKATSKSAVVRRRLRSKMSTAIRLVIGHSADAIEPLTTDQSANSRSHADPGGRPATRHPLLNLVQRPLSENERFVLQDWTYLVIPELTVYKMPLPNLVREVRSALVSLGHQSMRLESSWSARLPAGKWLPGTLSPPHRK